MGLVILPNGDAVRADKVTLIQHLEPMGDFGHRIRVDVEQGGQVVFPVDSAEDAAVLRGDIISTVRTSLLRRQEPTT